MRRITEKEYKDFFAEGKGVNALREALDIRKFEIGLYWQRAAYFWALIAVAFAGYFAILSSDHLDDKEYLAFIVSCIGLIFNLAWFLANRGSKFWQENWENHVDMLEDATNGPLYKTILSRPPEKDIFEKFIIGPAANSPSKINQWVGSFTMCIWAFLLWHTLPAFSYAAPPSYRHILVGIVTSVCALLMIYKGKTSQESYEHWAKKRQSEIMQEEK